MKITKGKVQGAQKVVCYGPEGIGKSTFASMFPEPIFIDTEGSTKELDVSRFEKASSWTFLLEQVKYMKSQVGVYKTLIIDTIDWAEQLCIDSVCATHGKNGIEEFGYGNGYVYVKEEFGRLLNLLTEVIDVGIHVVLTAHSQIRKFEQPDELGSYDRYELKLGKKTSSQTAPLIKEWADMVLFANYETYAVSVDDKGKKHKAQGGKRVMYTEHHPCWDAKNRHGLPSKLEFSFASIAHIFNGTQLKQQVQPAIPKEPIIENRKTEATSNFMDIPPEATDSFPFQQEVKETVEREKAETTVSKLFKLPEHIPKALRDLMEKDLVTEEELQKVVAQRGYFPINTPITNYPDDFIQGVLIGAWVKVFGMIKQLRESYEIPFENK